jgi:hypothetical protein
MLFVDFYNTYIIISDGYMPIGKFFRINVILEKIHIQNLICSHNVKGLTPWCINGDSTFTDHIHY